MKNELVLCIDRLAIESIAEVNIIPGENSALLFDVSQVDQEDLHFLNRTLCDSKRIDDSAIAERLPQLLPYVLVRCGDEYLTYSRGKGNESRLHSKLSCGFGGHVEYDDFDYHNKLDLTDAVVRELMEEINFDPTEDHELYDETVLLLDDSNPVGRVHAGVVYTLTIHDKDAIDAETSEISVPQWQTLEQLNKDCYKYENWSQSLIQLLNQGEI